MTHRVTLMQRCAPWRGQYYGSSQGEVLVLHQLMPNCLAIHPFPLDAVAGTERLQMKYYDSCLSVLKPIAVINANFAAKDGGRTYHAK